MSGFVLIFLAVFLLGLMNKVLDTHTKSEIINSIIRLEKQLDNKSLSYRKSKRINNKLHSLYLELCSINELEKMDLNRYANQYSEKGDYKNEK